jgi:hypothetical protein
LLSGLVLAGVLVVTAGGGAFGFIEQRASVKLSETGKQSLACSFDHPETAVPFEALKSILDTN